MSEFPIVTATFRPKRTDNLQNNAEAYIGVRTRWLRQWSLDDEGYPGQHAWQPLDPAAVPSGWVPTEDLADVEVEEP